MRPGRSDYGAASARCRNVTGPITEDDWAATLSQEWPINGVRINGRHNGHNGAKPVEPEEQRDDTPATWAPVDLTDILAGTYVPEAPALMARTDGRFLLYRGRVHSFHGESESGKSLIVQAHAAQLLIDGGQVVYIDYESDAAAVVGRLIELGVPVEAIRHRFVYIHPETSPTKREAERQAWAALLSQPFDLAVIDGVTDALGTVGAKSNDNDEIAAWCRNIARRIARNTGAAVILIDHVTKDAESRGRFALGGQAKMNALDGAAYVVEVVEALGRGMRGVVSLRIAKDRPGGVRAHCGTFRKLDRTQEAARIVVDSRVANRIDVTVEAPAAVSTVTMADRFRPTVLMERVSRFMQGAPGELSLNRIRESVSGKAKVIDEAVTILAVENFLEEGVGPRSARMFRHVKLYTEFQDPKVRQPEDSGAEATSSPPRPHLVPDEVPRPRPSPPIPEGDGDEVVAPATRSKTAHLVPAGFDAEEQCTDCGFHPNSVGHFGHCEEERWKADRQDARRNAQ